MSFNINRDLFFLNTAASDYDRVQVDTSASDQTLILTTAIKSFQTLNNWAQGTTGYFPKIIQDATLDNLDVNEVLYLNNEAVDYNRVLVDTSSSDQTLIFTTAIVSFQTLNNWAQGISGNTLPTVQDYLASIQSPEISIQGLVTIISKEENQNSLSFLFRNDSYNSQDIITYYILGSGSISNNSNDTSLNTEFSVSNLTSTQSINICIKTDASPFIIYGSNRSAIGYRNDGNFLYITSNTISESSINTSRKLYNTYRNSSGFWKNNSGCVKNAGAYVAIKFDKTIFCWGKGIWGGNTPSDSNNVIYVCPSRYSFTALKNDGRVITWGTTTGGSSSPEVVVPSDLLNVIEVYSTESAFAALKSDGTVVAWGDPIKGGDMTSTILVENNYHGGSFIIYRESVEDISNVVQIYSTYSAFAALKSDGTVSAWGAANGGGDLTNYQNTSYDYSNYNTTGEVLYTHNYGIDASDLSNVVQIYSNYRAFAALKSDGTVTAWGGHNYGGDITNTHHSTSIRIDQSDLSNVVQIYATYNAFAALKADGTVSCWGSSTGGGDMTNSDWAAWHSPQYNVSIPDQSDLSNVIQIYATQSAFAALKNDGTVVSWGSPTSGGDMKNSHQPNSIQVDVTDISNVVQIYSNTRAFAALKSDGTVSVWGGGYNGWYGGNNLKVSNLNNVVQIYNNNFGFAALKSDGTVSVWGDPGEYGDYGTLQGSVPSENNFVHIMGNSSAFAGLLKDGRVVSWGDETRGGNGSNLSSLNDIKMISNDYINYRLI